MSIVSGVGIFCFGFGLTFYNGVIGLIAPQLIETADLSRVRYNFICVLCEKHQLVLKYLTTVIICFGFGLTFYNGVNGVIGLVAPQLIDTADLSRVRHVSKAFVFKMIL